MTNSVPFRFHANRKRCASIVRSRHQECTSQGVPTYVPLFSKRLRNICFSPTSHPLALSIPEKHYKFFGYTDFYLGMKTHFKTTTRVKGYAYHPERILDNIFLPFTASRSRQRYTSTVWSRENDYFRPYMAILRMKAYLDDHL